MIDLACYSVNSIPRTNNNKSKNSGSKKAQKQIAREVGVALASLAIGKSNAKLGYKVAAKVSKKIKKTQKKPRPSSNQVMIAPRMKLFSQPTGSGITLSAPALNYLRSFVTPFDVSVKNVGMPRPGSMPSYKVTGFTRGIAQIGKKGVGFVYFAPTLCNDRVCIANSHTDYDQNFIASLPTDVYGATAASPAIVFMSNLPYSYAQLTSTSNAATFVEGRIVSASFRAYYTGTTLNESGQFYAYADPNFDSIVGNAHTSTTAQTIAYDIPSLGSKDATEIRSTGRKDMNLVMVPPANFYSDYPATNSTDLRKTFPYCNNLSQGLTSALVGAANAVIAITGVPGQPFYYECITHAEYVGPGVVQALLSPSYTDTVGYDAIQMLLNRAQRRCASDARVSFAQCVAREAAAEGIRL